MQLFSIVWQHTAEQPLKRNLYQLKWESNGKEEKGIASAIFCGMKQYRLRVGSQMQELTGQDAVA